MVTPPKYFILFFLTIMASMVGCKKEIALSYPQKPEVSINAGSERLNADTIKFANDTVYILATDIIIQGGQILHVEAGTLIKINNAVNITILAGGKIIAEGSLKDPIIFTSSAAKGKQLGLSPTGSGLNNWGNFQVNGHINGSSSGSIKFTRFEFFEGIQLNNVSNTTEFNFVQASYSLTNAFHFSGGNVNGQYLVSYSAVGSDFNFTNGFKGYLQNLLAYRFPTLANTQLNLAGINIENSGTEPVISNATVLGPDIRYGINSSYTLGVPYRRAGLIVSANSRFHIRNSVILGPPALRDSINANLVDYNSIRSLYLDSRESSASLDSGRSDLTYSVFYEAASNTFYLPNSAYPRYNSADLKEFLMRPKYNNELYNDLNKFSLIDPFGYYDGIPNPFPNTTSPLFTGANFTNTSITSLFTNPFFKQVSYKGALGPDDWMKGWVNFIPLQTDYNNY